jgi:hypothetical protein
VEVTYEIIKGREGPLVEASAHPNGATSRRSEKPGRLSAVPFVNISERPCAIERRGAAQLGAAVTYKTNGGTLVEVMSAFVAGRNPQSPREQSAASTTERRGLNGQKKG